jgi:cytochrome P450
MPKTTIYFVLFCSIYLHAALAFAPSSNILHHDVHRHFSHRGSCGPPNSLKNAFDIRDTHPSTSLCMSALSTLTANLPLVRKVGVLSVAVVFLVMNFQSILWPKSCPDKSVDALLPPGTMGCPLFGHGIKDLKGTKKFGQADFMYKLVKRFPNSRLIRYYALGTPYVVLADGKNIKELLNTEFEDDGVATFVPKSKILGDESILTESDKKKHSRLRRLIGQSMTPAAVSKSIPTLKNAAEKQIEILRNAPPEGVSANVLCTGYSVDVAWNQILGLELKEEEIPIYEKAVNDWLSGCLDIFALYGIRIGFLKHWKAMDYLKTKIGQKIDELKQKGPDSSTLSGLVFAVDEEDAKEQLTRSQIIDNVLVMILAGSETSASTLAISLLALKLNPNTWTTLVEEQQAMMKNMATFSPKPHLTTNAYIWIPSFAKP